MPLLQVHVEIVTGFWNFQAFLEPLKYGLHGITIQKHGEDVNHCFRYVLRRDLENYRVHKVKFNWVVQNTVQDYLLT